jgi:hypothetical protein
MIEIQLMRQTYNYTLMQSVTEDIYEIMNQRLLESIDTNQKNVTYKTYRNVLKHE